MEKWTKIKSDSHRVRENIPVYANSLNSERLAKQASFDAWKCKKVNQMASWQTFSKGNAASCQDNTDYDVDEL